MTRVLVYGSGTFGQVVRALIGDCGREFAGFIDDWNHGPEVVGNLQTLLASPATGAHEIALAIGYRHLDARLALYSRLRTAGLRFSSLIHPAAYLARRTRVGEGAIVMARATVDVEATIGPIAVLWPGAIVNHGSEIGGNSFLSPGAIVCGNAQVGSSCFIGAGAVVTDGVRVPDGSFVKAATRYSGGPLPSFHAPA